MKKILFVALCATMICNVVTVQAKNIKVNRNEESAKRWLSRKEENGYLPLWQIHWYFEGENSGVFPKGMTTAQLMTYAGFKKPSMETWDGAFTKMVKKCAPTLNSTEKADIAATLSFNANLMDSLAKLTPGDMQAVIGFIRTITEKQTKNHDWLTSSQAKTTLVAEYNTLNKVWHMPALMKCSSDGEAGGYYLLGKKAQNPMTEENHLLIWNTRYLNKYQYAIHMFYRRCLDVGAKSPQEYKAVASHIASTMRLGVNLLQ